MADYMVRASAAGGFARAFAVTNRGALEYARKAHGLSPVASAALGRTMAAGHMMGAMLKGEKDVLTIRFEGDGPIGGITVTARADGSVKGYVGNPGVILPPNKYGHFDVGGAVGKGILRVLRDVGLKEPYAGEVDIRSGEIAEDIAYYYALSEQVPTVCALGVLMNKDNTVRESGGYMIQLMPGCPEELAAALEQKVTAMPPVTELLRGGKTPEEILEDILGDRELVIHESMPVRFRCDCSRERVTAALIALGRKELTAIIDEGKPETLRCGFCGSAYTFTVEEMREILRNCRR